jgi:hypothetical protein
VTKKSMRRSLTYQLLSMAAIVLLTRYADTYERHVHREGGRPALQRPSGRAPAAR